MKNTNNNPNAFQHKRQCKGNGFKAQKIQVFEAFKRIPSTMLMVSIETGILRANICRFVAKWRLENRIALIEYKKCKISKHKAGYYLTKTETLTKS